MAVTWYLGGFVVLFVCAMTQTGPTAWAAAWQVRHWGGDEVIGSFLPGFAALLLRPALPLERRLRLFRTARGIAAGSSAACLASGIVAAWLSRMPGAQPAGSPLPAMTLTALSAPGTVLPAYASIVGATAQHGSAWEHRETLRRTLISDLYIPLTAWRSRASRRSTALERHSASNDLPQRLRRRWTCPRSSRFSTPSCETLRGMTGKPMVSRASFWRSSAVCNNASKN